ncbi:MAG: mechanosensitive ion channel [Verrucomicrobia bacterium]|jgi:small-conductance mechanosensitive channel|nr:mechanosensitive ion channel [Verrucomicrobiota bacterium]
MKFLEIWGDLLLPTGRFVIQDLWQLLLLGVVVLAVGRLVKPANAELLDKTSPRLWLRRNLGFLLVWIALVISSWILETLGGSASFFRFFACLGALWILIGLFTSLLRERFWARSLAFVLFIISGLHAIAYAEGSIEAIQRIEFTVGTVTVSAWGLAAGLLAFALTLWISLGVAHLIEKQVQSQRRLSPSLKVLIIKVVRILLLIVAAMIALSSMGVNLASLTVLGGAIGLGLGFGLQKVVSNFVSGVLLLLDRSIKPGDVIEIDGTYGWINNLRARYASVITRDGTEHLIPNEDLITQRVINWSFTDELVRIKLPVGVSYKADPHECIRLVLEAVESHERVLKDPAPNCLLTGFGDSSVNLELRFWLGDPSNGIGNVKSHLLLAIWDTLKEHTIEIPFPQRDLHLRSSDVDFVQRTHPDPD